MPGIFGGGGRSSLGLVCLGGSEAAGRHRKGRDRERERKGEMGGDLGK